MKALKHLTRVTLITTGLAFAAPVVAAPLDTNPSCGDEKHGGDDEKKDEKKGDDKA